MLKGIHAQDGAFLSGLTRIENRINKANQDITSGVRVRQASDDPFAVVSILQQQNQIDHLAQVQTNLQQASTEATTADGVLQSVGTIVDQLISISAQGVNEGTSSDTRVDLGRQVQELGNQLVSMANTSIGNRYVFGGDDPNTQPYAFNWSVSGGVVRNSTASATSSLSDGNGSTINPRMTATQIFDSRNSDGTPAANNIFQAVYALGQALAGNNQAGIQTALGSLKLGAGHLQDVSVFYGTVETWITQATNNAETQTTALQQSLSKMQDVDLPSTITQMTTDQIALQASLSAHAGLSSKSLFDFLG